MAIQKLSPKTHRGAKTSSVNDTAAASNSDIKRRSKSPRVETSAGASKQTRAEATSTEASVQPAFLGNIFNYTQKPFMGQPVSTEGQQKEGELEETQTVAPALMNDSLLTNVSLNEAETKSSDMSSNQNVKSTNASSNGAVTNDSNVIALTHRAANESAAQNINLSAFVNPHGVFDEGGPINSSLPTNSSQAMAQLFPTLAPPEKSYIDPNIHDYKDILLTLRAHLPDVGGENRIVDEEELAQVLGPPELRRVLNFLNEHVEYRNRLMGDRDFIDIRQVSSEIVEVNDQLTLAGMAEEYPRGTKSSQRPPAEVPDLSAMGDELKVDNAKAAEEQAFSNPAFRKLYRDALLALKYNLRTFEQANNEGAPDWTVGKGDLEFVRTWPTASPLMKYVPEFFEKYPGAYDRLADTDGLISYIDVNAELAWVDSLFVNPPPPPPTEGDNSTESS